MGKVLEDPFTMVAGAKLSYSESQDSPLMTEGSWMFILVLNSSICGYL